MTTKKYLSQIERIDKTIQNKLSEIYQLRSLATDITVATDKEKIQTSSDKDKIGNAVSRIVDLENETSSMINDYINTRKKIIREIDSISNKNYYQVLFSRYVEYKTMDEIAEKMNYSWRQIIRIHGSALIEFEKLYGSEYLS